MRPQSALPSNFSNDVDSIKFMCLLWLLSYLNYHPPSEYVYKTDSVALGQVKWGRRVTMARSGSIVIHFDKPYGVLAILDAPDVTVSIGIMPPNSTGYSTTDWYTTSDGGLISIGPYRAIVEIHSLASASFSYVCTYLGPPSDEFVYTSLTGVEAGLVKISHFDPNDRSGYIIARSSSTASFKIWDVPADDPTSVASYAIGADQMKQEGNTERSFSESEMLIFDVIVSKPVDAKCELRVNSIFLYDLFGTVTYEDAQKQECPFTYKSQDTVELAVMTSAPSRVQPDTGGGGDDEDPSGLSTEAILGMCIGIPMGLSVIIVVIVVCVATRNSGDNGRVGRDPGVTGATGGCDYAGGGCDYGGGGGCDYGGGGGCDFGGDFGGATAD